MRTETQDTSNDSMKKTFSDVYMMTEGDRLVSKNENREPNDIDVELKIDSLVHQACDERSRLLKAMQCTGDIFDSNVHCVSHVLSLRRSQIVEKGNYEHEIGVRRGLQEGINQYDIVHI